MDSTLLPGAVPDPDDSGEDDGSDDGSDGGSDDGSDEDEPEDGAPAKASDDADSNAEGATEGVEGPVDPESSINPEDLYQRPKQPPPEWIEDVLTAINEKRILHHTPPLIWNSECYEYAKRQADTCMQKGKLKHGLNDTVQGKLGQCILGPKDPGGPWPMKRKGAAEKIVEQWYKEKNHYHFDHPGHHEKSANFEQLIWFATTSVGLAVSRDGKYVVANFYPAGPDHSAKEPCQEKGRKLYFPPNHEVLQMTNSDKYHSWFRTNMLPVKEGPAPWLGGTAELVPAEMPQMRPKGSKLNAGRRASVKGRRTSQSAPRKNTTSSSAARDGSGSPKSKAKQGRSGSPGGRSASPKPQSAGTPGAQRPKGRKVVDVKLMSPSSRKGSKSPSSKSPTGKSPKSPSSKDKSSKGKLKRESSRERMKQAG